MKVTEDFLKTAGFNKANGRAEDGADRWFYKEPPYTMVLFYTDNKNKNISVSDMIKQLVEEAMNHMENLIDDHK